MKALSIRQPWAWAIVNSDKRLENRDWTSRNPALRYRGQFLIHTGLRFDRYDIQTIREIYRQTGRDPDTVPYPRDPESCPKKSYFTGGFVGIATVESVVTASDSPWFFGPLALVLTHVHPVPFTPYKGALGFFDVPDSVVVDITSRMAA